MPIDFPDSPTENQSFTVGDKTWVYSGGKWVIQQTFTSSLDDLSNVDVPSPSSGQFLKWSGSAWVNDEIDLGTDTAGNYVSGVTAGTGVTVTHTPGEGSSPTIAIGQSVATNANPSFSGITADAIQVGVTAAGEIDTTAGNLTIDSAGGTVTVDDNLTVTGNLTVSGTTTSINTETLTVDDNIIVLNNNATGAPSEDAGIEVERGSSTNVAIRWNETTDKWQFTNDGSTYSDLGSGGGGLTISENAPASPIAGQLWFESDTGRTYVYYDSYWVEVGAVAANDVNSPNMDGGHAASVYGGILAVSGGSA
jgi:hypothetical protein